MLTELFRGIRRMGAVVPIVAALTPAAIYQVSNDPNQLGTKSFRLKKLMVQNLAGGACWLSLGTGLGGLFVANMPAFRVLNQIDNEWQEIEIPNLEYFVDLTASVDALVAAGQLNIQVEIEEIG